MAAPTQEQIDAAMAKAISQPKSVTIAGQTVTARDAEEIIALADHASSPSAKPRNVLSISRFCPGSPVD